MLTVMFDPIRNIQLIFNLKSSIQRQRLDSREGDTDRLDSLRWLAVAVVFVVCALLPLHAQAPSTPSPSTSLRPGPSTLEEREKFVTLVRFLERDPLAANASATRQQLRDWITEVPDIRFKVCPGLLGGAVGTDYPYAREFNLQVVLSGAILTLEDPGEARDDVAVYTAGIEGALRTYEVLVKSRPDARLAALDDLIGKRDRGELVDHLARLADDNCERSNALVLAALIGAAAGLLLALPVAYWFGRRTRGDITPRTATIVRRIVFACVAYYAIVGIALHFLEPEYDPRFQFMSDYAWGPYGWLMTTTFFVLGLALVTIALGLRDVHHSSPSARTGFGLLVIGALFVCMAGVFRGFPLHDVGGAVAFPSLVMAALFLSWSFRDAAGWQAIHPVTLVIALGMLAAVVSMVADVGMPGLQQRAFFCLLLLWLSIVVHRVQ